MNIKQDISRLSEADRTLIKIAGDHAKNRFKADFISIGGALRTKRGKVYTGINLKYRVRNASACAEVMAIHTALDDGESEFDTVVGVKYFPETDSYEIVNGCGWCRQSYIYNKPLCAIVDNEGVAEVWAVEKLLPLAFA